MLLDIKKDIIYKRVIPSEDMRKIKINAYNDIISKYRRKMLRKLKGEIHNSTIIVQDSKTLFSIMDRTTR